MEEHEEIDVELNTVNLPIGYAIQKDVVVDNSENCALHVCQAHPNNSNFTKQQKRLVQWHYKLGHCAMDQVKCLSSKGYIGSVIWAQLRVKERDEPDMGIQRVLTPSTFQTIISKIFS